MRYADAAAGSHTAQVAISERVFKERLSSRRSLIAVAIAAERQKMNSFREAQRAQGQLAAAGEAKQKKSKSTINHLQHLQFQFTGKHTDEPHLCYYVLLCVFLVQEQMEAETMLNESKGKEEKKKFLSF